jgi:uncharacterized protein YyaL (SSP411 family)
LEDELFENPEVAKLMNDVFINIKVDREERPDIDATGESIFQALQRISTNRETAPIIGESVLERAFVSFLD